MKSDTGGPATLSELATVEEYQRVNDNVFKSVASLLWFIRKHRGALLKVGALLEVNGRKMLHQTRMTEMVMELGLRYASERPRVFPLPARARHQEKPKTVK